MGLILSSGSRRGRIYFLFTLIGLAWVGFGLTMFWLTSNPSSEIPPTLLEEPAPNDQALVTVDVSGGVVKPGIYTLPAESRVGQAVDAAGGIASTAKVGQIHESINLAAKLTDGQKIFIPIQTQSTTEQLAISNQKGSDPTSSKTSINSATKVQLEALPGIGEKKAAEIISHRPFSTISEVQSLVSISDANWEAIETMITL